MSSESVRGLDEPRAAVVATAGGGGAGKDGVALHCSSGTKTIKSSTPSGSGSPVPWNPNNTCV
jgi:hypothetical protein